MVSYHGFGYRDLPQANARRQDYLQVIKRIFYSRFQNQVNLRPDFLLYATGDVGPGTIPADLRQRYNIPDHYLTEEAAWKLLQPAEYLKGPLAGRFRSAANLINKYATTDDWFHTDHAPSESMLEHEPAQIQFTTVLHPFSQPKVNMSSIVSVDIVPQLSFHDGSSVLPPHHTETVTATDPTKRHLTITIPTDDPRPGVHLLQDLSQELRLDLYQELHHHLSQELRPALDQELRQGPLQELCQGLFQEIRHGLFHELHQDLVQEIRLLLPKETHCDLPQQLSCVVDQRHTPVSEPHEDPPSGAIDYRRDLSHIRLALQYDPWSYAETGDRELYPYYGQGPSWNQNSCAWDSIIVATSLLNNAGPAIGGLAENPGLRPEQHAFLQLVTLDWMKLDSDQCNVQRDYFTQLYAVEFNKRNAIPYQIGGTQSVLRLWEDITDNVEHFSFFVNRLTQSCGCRQAKPQIGSPLKRSSVTNWMLNFASGTTEAKDLDLLLGNSFRQVHQESMCWPCEEPKRTTRYAIHGEPPRCLIVALDARCRPSRHTRTLKIPYDKLFPSSDGSPRLDKFEATYEWLFGIYSNNIATEDGVGFPHFAVFCDDFKAGGETPRPFIHYDDLAAKGAIVGGLQDPSRGPDDRVPQYWMDSCPPLLCYRLVGTLRTEVGASLHGIVQSPDKAVSTEVSSSSAVAVKLPDSPGSHVKKTNAEPDRMEDKSLEALEEYSRSLAKSMKARIK